MGLHDRDDFTEFVSTLAGVTLHEQWEALVAKVGGKVFCLLGDASGDLVFKVGEIAFDGLTGLEGIEQAAYFAKRQWVRVSPGALEAALAEGYIRESHRLIADKLTRKLKAELGL
ncbi:MAG TPA: MmcQ/YjbR family DNA-binding protein [Devosia sp.]|uniref:MmcQ/YjbR family DNA-binding protein n=1 Tax=Devosia sp. TaxID=1871048 RepID=UPI002DDD5A5E|nr:MmcQ/YjbR family DNA-binding protein [Devosia sp.]HEV2516043.1 MmcQ/YjbR family DNA-binding protein [Devosia sp.]